VGLELGWAMRGRGRGRGGRGGGLCRFCDRVERHGQPSRVVGQIGADAMEQTRRLPCTRVVVVVCSGPSAAPTLYVAVVEIEGGRGGGGGGDGGEGGRAGAEETEFIAHDCCAG
jgi:hypothetical protein